MPLTALFPLLQVTNNAQTKATIAWVKAHQDIDKRGRKVTGPLIREAQLNYEVDSLLKKKGVAQAENRLTPPRRV